MKYKIGDKVIVTNNLWAYSQGPGIIVDIPSTLERLFIRGRATYKVKNKYGEWFLNGKCIQPNMPYLDQKEQ